MLIRNYHPTDHKQIIELLRLNTPRYFAPSEERDLTDFLAHHIDQYFVGEETGRILVCGGFNLADEGRIARISWDIVSPEDQGRGIGSELTHFRIRKIQEIESVKTISVRTSQQAYQFYETFGFECREIIRDFWAEGFDLYRMERDAVLVKNFDRTYLEVIRQLRKRSVRHEVHRFPSGAAMVDIWINGLFYAIQFQGDLIGFSEVNENSGFSTIPDEKFEDAESFLIGFRSILNG